MMMRLARFHFHVRGENPPALHLFRRNAPAIQLEFPQLGFDLAQIGARIHQRAQHHVAADARKTVKIGDTHGFHEVHCRVIAASRENDTSLPPKSCQIRRLHRPARAQRFIPVAPLQ